jgi:23S rRNA pseudouridine1911/1915/1917 synthase
MSLAVLYEDFHILVINKAPGLVVHPGAGHTEGTLVHGLLAHCPNLALQGAPLRPGIVHRLDKDTSGVLVVAKTERAYLNLVRQFQEREVRKEYLALVFGAALPIRGEIRTQLGRHPAERKKIAVTRSGTGREAITCWQVERVWGSEVSLLRVRIETGRTHQIRVHLSHLRHPVIGDPVYGGKRRLESLQDKEMRRVLKPVRRQLLHACTLALRHPETGSLHVFQAPLASDFAAVLEALDRYQGAQPKR